MLSRSRDARHFHSVFMARSKLHLLLALVVAQWVHCVAEPASCTLTETEGSSSTPMECGSDSDCSNGICNCKGGYFTISGTHTDCQGEHEPDERCQQFQENCVYCGVTFEGPCLKCVDVIYNTQCYDACPEGTMQSSEYLANMSLAISYCEGVGNADIPTWAIAVIIVLGGVVLIITAILITSIACTFLRRSTVGQFDFQAKGAEAEVSEEQTHSKSMLSSRRNQYDSSIQEKQSVKETDHAMDEYFGSNQSARDSQTDNVELEKFLVRLDHFRSDAEVFLKMLNDMRRRLKELPQKSTAAQQYRNVIKDLTRLLYLLNKDPEHLTLPADANRLLDWSESILNRYLQAQGQQGSHPQSQSGSHSHSGLSTSTERHTAPNSNSYRSASRSSHSNKTSIKHQSTGRISYIGDQVETGF